MDFDSLEMGDYVKTLKVIIGQSLTSITSGLQNGDTEEKKPGQNP